MKNLFKDLQVFWFFFNRPGLKRRIAEGRVMPPLITEEARSLPHKNSMYCSFCGSAIKIDSNFCSTCGKPLTDKESGNKEALVNNSESNKSGEVPKRRNFAWAGFVGFLIIFIFLFNVLASEYSGDPSPSVEDKRIAYLNCIDSYRGWGWTTNPEYAQQACVHLLK